MMLFGYLLPAWALKLGLSVVIVGGFVGWLKLHDLKTVTTERVRVQTEGAKTHAKAITARAAVPATGSIDRLRAKNCRDC